MTGRPGNEENIAAFFSKTVLSSYAGLLLYRHFTGKGGQVK